MTEEKKPDPPKGLKYTPPAKPEVKPNKPGARVVFNANATLTVTPKGEEPAK